MITVKKFKKLYPKLKEKWIEINGKGGHQKLNKRLTGAIKFINSISNSLCSSLNVLDVGCNNGVYSIVASKKFKNVIGIDIDREKKVIKKAKFASKYFHVKNCSFYYMSFFDYVKDKQFFNDNINAIMVFQVLHHLNNEEINMMRDILPNIQLLIVGVHPEISEDIKPGKPANELGLYNIKQVKNLFSPYFSDIKIRNKDTRWPNLMFYN